MSLQFSLFPLHQIHFYFESIKYFYDINCYTNEDIQTYVELDAIDKDQYKEITGEEYPESQAE
ncbi:XkdX family protein [Staphylococcus pseudoxylosus]|uniref:XkdX family protein n=1 Tax=Staphylococcus pseudoxylosus TaxID=2282419 RepID=UPI002DBB1A46|nr:XkdX family protein [Staphylococcus pseudoxylosus]MEB6035922.1 XkdX family protein [Staphylococcus pseudoxylosus]MEB6045215.1 XkdX family protein [Staphylococcus pseudoxylosus]MEB7763005.1 XkdX family protein [Staphylococcus pseudoxylosus]MEB8008093.1 XkdX family protein [Staphylococcus pseudoxylosus]